MSSSVLNGGVTSDADEETVQTSMTNRSNGNNGHLHISTGDTSKPSYGSYPSNTDLSKPNPYPTTTNGAPSVAFTPTGTMRSPKHLPADDIVNPDIRRDRLLQIYLPNSALLKWLIIKALQWIVPLELFLFMLPVFINYGICPSLYDPTVVTSSGAQGGGIFIFAFFHLFSFIAIVSSTFVLMFELGHHVVKPSHLVSMYFAIVIHYASWYQLVYACNTNSIALPTVDTDYSLGNRMVVFFYLSTAIMTTAGLGDCFPVMWWCKAIAMTEMVLSLLYTTGIFGIGLDHFRSVMERAEREANNPSLRSTVSTLPFNDFLQKIKTRYPVLDRMRVLAIKWILPLTVVIQLVLLGLLVAAYGHSGHIFGADDNTSANAGQGVVNFLCLLFQFFQFILVLISSLQIIRVINAKDMSLTFLIQSYIALMTLFGGIYLTIYLFVGKNGFTFNDLGFNIDDQNIFKTFGEMLWFSFVVMTTIGFGDVAPIHTAARIFVFLEMLLSVFYGIVVLGIAMARTMHSWSQSKIALPALPDEGGEEELGAPADFAGESSPGHGHVYEASSSPRSADEEKA